MTATGTRLRDWADQSLLASQALLARHPPAGTEPVAPRRFGSATAYVTGRPAEFFNAVVVLDAVEPAAIEAGVRWIREHTPASIRVRDDLDSSELESLAARLGLRREAWADPAMVLHPIPSAMPPAPPALDIEEASPATLDRFYAANGAGFNLPAPGRAALEAFTPPSVVADPDIRLFGGWLDGRPAACSYAIRSGGVVGVYAVGTAEWARRRGVATAMTWRAVEAGRDWGCEAATLQASAMGEPVYRKMGFVEVARYVAYVPVPSTASD